MDSNGLTPQFYLPSEPLPVPSLRDIVPIPNSPEEQSFVIIKSAADLDNLSDDNDVSHNASILSVNKRLIEEELRDSVFRYTEPTPREPTPDETDSELNREAVTNGFHVDCNQKNGEPSGLMSQSYLSFDSLDEMGTVKFSKGDFCSQEIEFKVAQLITQNKRLKDTIIQNSKTMENQKQKIVVWQEKSKEVHEVHREKLLEARNLIDTLNKEKVALKAKITSLEAEHEILNTPTKEELDVANKRIKELEESVIQLTLSNQNRSGIVDGGPQLLKAQTTIALLEHQLQEAEEKKKEELASLTANNTRLINKVATYDRELEKCYREIKELQEQSHTEECVEVEELKLLKEKLFTSEMANDRMRDEITSLRRQVARALGTSDNVTRLEHDVKVAQAERDRMVAELDARNSQIVDLSTRLDEMKQQLLQATDKAQNDLRVVLEREEQAKVETWRAVQRSSELQQQLQLVQKNLEAKAQQVLAQQASNPGELAYVRQQLVQTHLSLNEAVQKKAVAEAQLTVTRKEVERLTRELESSGSADEIFALKAQLEQFRADFEAEKKAKEEEKARGNKMSEDLQQVHRRNQQLQEEVELLRAQNSNAPRAPPSSSNNSHTSPQRGSYPCPKCHFTCNDLRAAEVHINRCLDLEDSLP